jgi:hypothetical protein
MRLSTSECKGFSDLQKSDGLLRIRMHFVRRDNGNLLPDTIEVLSIIGKEKLVAAPAGTMRAISPLHANTEATGSQIRQSCVRVRFGNTGH